MKYEYQSSEHDSPPNHLHIIREDHVRGLGKLKIAVFDDPLHGFHCLFERRAAYPCQSHRCEDDVLKDLYADLFRFDVDQLLQQIGGHIESWGRDLGCEWKIRDLALGSLNQRQQVLDMPPVLLNDVS